MDIAEILLNVRELTISGMAILGVVALAKGWVVTRGHYEDMRTDLQATINYQREIIRRLKNGNNP